MKVSDFKTKLTQYESSAGVDISFLQKWFEGTIKTLDALYKQQSGIANPRHRGDAREKSLSAVFRDLLPDRFLLQKGYAVNRFGTRSLEQDIMIVDSLTSCRLIRSEGVHYFPIESVLASIQVKSTLNLAELRDAIVNGASLKHVTRDLLSERQDRPINVMHCVFAFKSSHSLEKMCNHLNKICSDVPARFRPNAIYILGEGALIPSDDGGFSFIETQFFSEGKFATLKHMGTKVIKNSEAYALLYYLAGIADHCAVEAGRRDKLSLMSYMATPLIVQSTIENIQTQQNAESAESGS